VTALLVCANESFDAASDPVVLHETFDQWMTAHHD
jgi:hypothetical protein